MSDLSKYQELKLRILAEGITVTEKSRNWIQDVIEHRGLSSADYASTSGVILRLGNDTWVNAPIEDHNPNFVDKPEIVLDYENEELIVRYNQDYMPAAFCLPPAYQGSTEMKQYPPYVMFTHADRARLSPMSGCSMACRFCGISFEKPSVQYELFSPETCIEVLEIAVNDPIQPARHIMISGGTPRPTDIEAQKEMYYQVLSAFPKIDIDIMMVPMPGLLDVAELNSQGVNELSINIEIFDEDESRRIIPQKHKYGHRYYLDFIENAVEELGVGRVRSMLLVGLEPIESTLKGVEAIAERGGLPVLSPFRPDTVTPMRKVPPPSYQLMREVYVRGQEIATKYGVVLGPTCPPCTHNTLSFAEDVTGKVNYIHDAPRVLQ